MLRHKKFTLGQKAKISYQEHTCPLSKPPPPAEGFSTALCSEDVVYFIRTTAGRLGMVFTEFWTSSSVTSTTEQCSSSSGSGSAPPLLSHGCTCVGTHTALGWHRNGAQGPLQGQLSVLLHLPLPEMVFNQLFRKWLQSGSVLSQPLPPTGTMAHSESSLKQFENLSYLERFHFFLLHAAEQSPLFLLALMG